MRHLALAISLSTLFACSPHKIDTQAKPSVEAPAAYSQEIDSKNTGDKEQLSWWSYLDRPELSALIEKSLEANQDISQALARIEQARALQRSAGSERFPSLDIEASASESRRDNNQRNSTNEAGAVLSWEIDLFKAISSDAKAEELLGIALQEDLNALKLSLSAEVANAYFGAVSAHKVLQLLNEQLETDNSLLDLTELRLETGVGTRVEVLQQASRVAESESVIPLAEAQLRVYENRLDVLLGEAPDGINRVNASESLLLQGELPHQGVPSELLLNRPDLRAARAELIAADAGIASAIAERLPQLTLEGAYLYSDTGAASGPLAIATGEFIMPLLDWGKRRAQVKRNKALYTEKLASFSQRYLLAIEEVENSLYQEGKQRQYVQLLQKRRNLLQNTVEETEARYTQGVSDYLPVLNALQELRSVERDLVAEKLILVNLRITLHRALGGNLHPVKQENL